MSITIKEYKKIRGAFFRVAKNKQFSEDLAQDYVLLKLRGKVTPYYWQFANRYEKRYYMLGGIDPVDLELESDPKIDIKFIYDILDKDMNKTKNGRKILDLYLQGYEYSEIAEELGIFKQSAHKFMTRLIEKCKFMIRRDNARC